MGVTAATTGGKAEAHLHHEEGHSGVVGGGDRDRVCKMVSQLREGDQAEGRARAGERAIHHINADPSHPIARALGIVPGNLSRSRPGVTDNSVYDRSV